tara:strand:- start:190 stop:363 length:174 start_codon:yes stop_codon:yes gene_type:complete
MEKTLREIGDAPVRRIKFKPYTISDIPKSFDKDKHLWFNKDGLTWIEKIDNPWWENL